MGDREGSPERITDLLRQDDYMFEEEAPTPTAERAQSNKEAAFGGATNGLATQTSNASKRVPIPIPKPSAPASAPNGNGVASEGAAGSGPASMSELLGSGPRRFFIIKSNTAFNIDLSVEHGVWATQRHNEEKLNAAFRAGSTVLLVFSVNGSGHFQGFAKMVTLVNRQRHSNWENGASMGGTFDIDWIRRYDLPFQDTEGLYNPLNENKPVKICRDGQDLPNDLGERLIQLMEEGAEANGIPRPKKPNKPPPNARNGGQQPFMNRGGGRGGPRGPPGMGGMRPPRGMDGFPMGMMGGRPPMGMRPMMHPMMHPMMMQGMRPMRMQPDFGGGGDFGFMNMGGGGGGNPMMFMDGGGGGGFNGGSGNGFSGNRSLPRPPMNPPPDEDTPMFPRQVSAGPSGGGSGRMSRGMDVDDDMEDPQMLMYKAMMSQDMGAMQRAMAAQQRASDRSGGDERSRRRGDRHRRSRSRSYSPDRRSRSKRRGRSRSRSRSRSRDRNAFANMSYEDYVAFFNKMKGRGGSSSAAASASGNPMMQMMQMFAAQQQGGGGGMGAAPAPSAMASMMGGGNAGASAMGAAGAGGPAGGSFSANDLTEDQYVRVWEEYCKSAGQPFDPVSLRQMYRQHKG